LTTAYFDGHNTGYDYLVWYSGIREAATASKGLVRLLNLVSATDVQAAFSGLFCFCEF